MSVYLLSRNLVKHSEAREQEIKNQENLSEQADEQLIYSLCHLIIHVRPSDRSLRERTWFFQLSLAPSLLRSPDSTYLRSSWRPKKRGRLCRYHHQQNGSGCCKFQDQKTSQQQRSFFRHLADSPPTSQFSIVCLIFTIPTFVICRNDGIHSYLLLHQTTKPGCDPSVQLQRIPKVLRFDKHPIKIITEHLGVAFIDKAFTTNKERFLMSALDRTFSGLL